jgi:hypothetical protein
MQLHSDIPDRILSHLNTPVRDPLDSSQLVHDEGEDDLHDDDDENHEEDGNKEEEENGCLRFYVDLKDQGSILFY